MRINNRVSTYYSVRLEVENDILAFDCIYTWRIGHEAAMFLVEEVAFHALV